MPRVGLTPEVVIRAAGRLVDRDGPEGLTLAALASELGVKPPSLYNHVDGLDDLERSVAIVGIDLLADALRDAAMGRSGRDALWEVARAYRSVTRAHPGLYALAQVARPGDEEYQDRARRAIEPVLAILSGYGIDGDDAIHATRVIRSALHGFASLEAGQGFGIDLSVDETFDRTLEVLDEGLCAFTVRAGGTGAPAPPR